MTAMTTRWFMYGEPTGNGRVEAEIRQTYNDGSTDTVTYGTVGYESIELIENDERIQLHTQVDNNVILSSLSDEKEDELLETWEEHDSE